LRMKRVVEDADLKLASFLAEAGGADLRNL
jgi:hypothetical protein